jgi:7-cyano-7-deazaguanine reductase
VKPTWDAPSGEPSALLVTVDNPRRGRRYRVSCRSDELTCVCPMTGQPDFATVELDYEPDERIVELKSLKLYLWSYRQRGAFHEDVTNRILDDLLRCLDPFWARVRTLWNIRGGIVTTVVAEGGRDLAATSSTLECSGGDERVG